MGRKFGATDLRPRRTRSDVGKKRKLYRKKPVKTKTQIKYERRRGNKDHIKIRAFERLDMSPEGYARIPIRLKPTLTKKITRMHPVHLVHVSEINSKEKFEKFMSDRYWTGEFVIMGITYAKTKTGRKWVKLCRIEVKEHDWGNTAEMRNNYRLGKYWFWNK